MYKIYVNGRVLILLSEAELRTLSVQPEKSTLVSMFLGKKKIFRQHVDMLAKNSDIRTAYIWHTDLQVMWQEFLEAFTMIVAAGGLVENDQKQVLVFLRKGVWDLPKGKIDPGEVPTEAALREVEEECGLLTLQLGAFMCHTYHMYKAPKRMVLKKTWWYHMTTSQIELVPQTEEGIEIVQWEEKASVLARIGDFYLNLHDVLGFLVRSS
jgi:8-oxo-dGTP pyrophosphatase MutT (NUDIX family)